MKPPAFWDAAPDAPGVWPRVLSPLGWMYAGLTARRVAQPAEFQAKVPVICVGNVNAGGTGKTPTVIAILQLLSEMGVAGHVVSRGYGGSLTGPVRVDAKRHSAAEVGDEPLLLSAFAPVWIARNRAEGAKAACADGAQAIVLDDGLQ
ncbi:MAG: tetraacyldisaccharide 4'-kinase, partial [Pseudomonadota bacterium]